jgi:hypothetical protein
VNPFDDETGVGTAFVACTYRVDMRGLRGEDAGLLLLEQVRERVRAGRVLRPDAAHYVELVEAEDADEAARIALVSQLGERDGIDGVKAQLRRGWPSKAPAVVKNQEPNVVDAGHVNGPWRRLAHALENDMPLVGKVISVSVESDVPRVAMVDINGARGILHLGPEEFAKAGDEVDLHLIVFNLKNRRAEFVTAESAR